MSKNLLIDHNIWKAYLFHVLVPVPYLSHYDIIEKSYTNFICTLVTVWPKMIEWALMWEISVQIT